MAGVGVDRPLGLLYRGTLALYMLPYGLFGAFAGVAIDRFNRRTLMVRADIVRAALVLSVPAVATRWLPGVYLLAFATASVTVFFDPCKLAILPDLVHKKQLLRANSLLATTETITEIVGFAAAGFAYYYLSSSASSPPIRSPLWYRRSRSCSWPTGPDAGGGSVPPLRA